MHNGKHLSIIQGAAGDGECRTRLPRDIVLATIVVAILLLGVGAGGAYSPQSDALENEAKASAVQPSEFIYFPSQYVNQGTETPEYIPTF